MLKENKENLCAFVLVYVIACICESMQEHQSKELVYTFNSFEDLNLWGI